MKKKKEKKKEEKPEKPEKKETPGKKKGKKKQDTEIEKKEPNDVMKMKKMLEDWRKKPKVRLNQAAQGNKDLTVGNNVDKVEEIKVEVDMTKEVTVDKVAEGNIVAKARRKFSIPEKNDDFETWKRKRCEKRKLEDDDTGNEVKRKACRASELVLDNLLVNTNIFCRSEEGEGQVQAPEMGAASLDRVGDDRSGMGVHQYARSGGKIKNYFIQAKRRTTQPEGETGYGGTT